MNNGCKITGEDIWTGSSIARLPVEADKQAAILLR